MQHHVELPSPLVLRVELGPPVAEQIVGMLQPSTAAWKQQEPLVVEVVVVRQGQQSPPRSEIRHPVMRHVVRQAIPHVFVTGVDQQIHCVGADGASGKRILLPRQTEPAGGALSARSGQNVGRQVEPLLFVDRTQAADVLVLQSIPGDLVPVRQQIAQPFRPQLRDDGRDGECRPDGEATEQSNKLVKPIMSSKVGIGVRQVFRANALRTARYAEIHRDGKAASIAIGPAHLVAMPRDLVRDCVALFPRHHTASVTG
jgi:hypothetical protein